MYSKMIMLFAFVFMVFHPLHGFLLEPEQSAIQGKPVYLTAAEYYQDKIQLEQKMVSHGEINLLAAQLQSKLEAFEQKFLTKTTSTSQTSVAELEAKYHTQEQKLTILEQKNKVLEQSLASKEIEIAELKKNHTQLENNINQQMTAMKDLENRTQRHFDLNQNESLNHLQQYIDGQLQPVILTACNESVWTVERSSPLLFPHILTSVGVPDQTHFQLTGRFRCSIPGYYYVTTTLESDADSTIISIMVNSDLKHNQWITGKTDNYYTSGTSDVTLHLTTGDEVWIRSFSSSRSFWHSCFTIFKIK